MEPTKTLNSPKRIALILGVAVAVMLAAGAVATLMAIVARDRVAGEMDRAVTLAFKSTLLAIDNAVDMHSVMDRPFPAPAKLNDAGRPLSSWRFQITPYLEFESRFGGDLNAAWNAPANASVRERAPDSFCFPGADQPHAATNVFAIVGKGAAVDPDKPLRSSDRPDHLIVLMETAAGNVHWMQPGDYELAKLLAASGTLGDCATGVRPDRIHVIFGDAQVWALSVETPMERIKPFLTIEAAAKQTRTQLLGPYRLEMRPTTHR